jgi:hypothetical protein
MFRLLPHGFANRDLRARCDRRSREFRGIARRDTDTQLVAAGWLAVRIWEHEDPGEAARAIEQLVRDRTIEK